ncbi:MAG: alkaline phosphatase family protein [Nitrospirota bacterium]|nr:alkaline phosphatase family protein [Nitrospirota bacterium]
MSVRALVIGMTGGCLETLRRWAAIGWMPNLDYLFRKGSHGRFPGLVPPLPVAEWATLLTGKHPGHTGLTHALKKQPGSYFLERAHLSFSRAEPFWSALDRADQRTVLVNIPFPAEPLPINGLVVSPEGVFAHRAINAPDIERTLRRIHARLGSSSGKKGGDPASPKDPFDFLDRRIGGAIQQGTVIRDLLGSKSWDLAIVNFSGVDRVLSRFYAEIHHVREKGPETPLSDLILTYFKVLDDAIGQVVQTLEKEGLAIMISGHEIGDLEKCFSLNHYLKERGDLSFRMGRDGRSTLSRYVSPLIRALGIRRHSLKNVLEAVGSASLADCLALPFSEDLGIFDWKKTRAFSLESHAIRINLKGRETMGSVSEGAEYRQVGEEIIAGLRAIRDPDTGSSVVSDVRWTEEIYDGPRLSDLPDLVITDWNPRYSIPDFENVREQNDVFFTPSDRTGAVRKEGFSLVMGPGIPKGVPMQEPFSLLHVAPAVLSFLGFAVPPAMERPPFPESSGTRSTDPENSTVQG